MAHNTQQDPPKLYIYNWAQYIPQDIIEEFEQETHIQVIYDSFDSLEVLETKIFTNPGYDLVFPAAWPLLARCIQADLLIPLDYSLLPNARLLDPILLEKLQTVDPGGRYSIPYLWGTVGFGYDVEALQEMTRADPSLPPLQDSLGILFDVSFVQKLAPLRIFLLDSPMDVFQAALLYLGLDPTTENRAHWDKAIALIHTVRPYIHTLTGSRQQENLLEGQSHLLQGFSTYINMARLKGSRLSPPRTLSYVIPKEGAIVWFDMMAIPKGAAHVRNAHVFINFLLRPQIMARISNAICAANPIPASKPWVNKEILENPTIFLTPETLNRIHGDFVPSAALQRYLSRAWLKIKVGYPP